MTDRALATIEVSMEEQELETRFKLADIIEEEGQRDNRTGPGNSRGATQ